MQYNSAANATLLNYAAPIWVALFAWLVHKEKLALLFWIGLACTLLGMAVVLSGDFFRHPSVGRGDLLAIVSSFFYAGYFIVTESGRKRMDTLSYIWMVGVSSTLTMAVVVLSLGLPFSGYPAQTYWAFFGEALFSQIGGYLAIGDALGHLPASVVSPTMVGQPVLTALLAMPLLGEKLVSIQIMGGLVVLVGVYWVHRGRMSAR